MVGADLKLDDIGNRDDCDDDNEDAGVDRLGAVGRWSVWFRGFPGGDLMRVYFLGLLDPKSVRVVMLSFLIVVFL